MMMSRRRKRDLDEFMIQLLQIEMEKEFEVKYPRLKNYCKDLVKTVFTTRIQRQRWKGQVDKIIKTFGGYNKYCACLVGDTDADNREVIDALAERVKRGKDHILCFQGLRSLDLKALVDSYTHLPPTMKSKKIKDEIKNTLIDAKKADVIIFIENIHAVVGTPRDKIYNIIFEALQSQQVLCIGASSVKDYRDYIASSDKLRRHFERIDVVEDVQRVPRLYESTSSPEGANRSAASCLTMDEGENDGSRSDTESVVVLDADTTQPAAMPSRQMEEEDEQETSEEPRRENVGGGTGGTTALPDCYLLVGGDGPQYLRYARQIVLKKYGSKDALIHIYCAKYIDTNSSFECEVFGSSILDGESLGTIDKLKQHPSQVVYFDLVEHIRDSRALWCLTKLLKAQSIVPMHHGTIDLSKTTIVCSTHVGAYRLWEASADKLEEAKGELFNTIGSVFHDQFCQMFEPPNRIIFGQQSMEMDIGPETIGSRLQDREFSKKRRYNESESGTGEEHQVGSYENKVAQEFLDLMRVRGATYHLKTDVYAVSSGVKK